MSQLELFGGKPIRDGDCPPLRYMSRADGSLPPMKARCYACGAVAELPKGERYFGNWLVKQGWRWKDRDERGVYYEGIRFYCPRCSG